MSGAFVGEGSLLARCAELYLGAGRPIALVVTSEERVRTWAAERGIPCTPDLSALEHADLDELFSVASTRVIPASVLRRVRVLAANFHDGPLPAYAGLHAPAWAILNGETEHGVSWHAMTEQVDAGPILAQARFPIEPRDTALTLNARCYEAGIATFQTLLDDLARGSLRPCEQDLSRRTYYARDRRPDAAAFLRWDRPAQQLAALVAALDSGPYWSPLGLPKLLTERGVIAVREARVADARSGTPPGTVVVVEDGAVRIATATADLLVTRCTTLADAPLTLADLSEFGVVTGVRLPMLGAEDAEALTALNARCAPHEGYWRKRLGAPLATLGEAAASPVLPTRRAGDDALRAVETVTEEAPHDLLALAVQRADGVPSARVLLGAFALFLARLGGGGAVTVPLLDAGLRREVGLWSGVFATDTPLVVDGQPDEPVDDALRRVVHDLGEVHGHFTYPRDLVGRDRHLRAAVAEARGPAVAVEALAPAARSSPLPDGCGLSLGVADDGRFVWTFDPAAVDRCAVERLRRRFLAFARSVLLEPERPLGSLSALDESDRALLAELNATERPYRSDATIHQVVREQAERTPDRIALVFDDTQLTYSELLEQAGRLARGLRARGVRPDDRVGVCLDRSPDMVVALLGVLMAGAAYVPLDPAYPTARLELMAEDAGLTALVTRGQTVAHLGLSGWPILDVDSDLDRGEGCDRGDASATCHADDISGAATAAGAPHRVVVPEVTSASMSGENTGPLPEVAGPDDLAYVIYTSGSTGRPKGVMVTHRNVLNFFASMDERIPHDPPGVWLAVTSPSFDISVLELFWTLARGFTVVLHAGAEYVIGRETPARPTAQRGPDFSLLYFASGGGEPSEDGAAPDRYRLLLEGARFADEHGFRAVWTPERHFHAFGGLFPNPSVTSAALATITRTVQLRAGSLVLPLHDPVRVVEEWALVDNLSNGRVGISFAAGWQPHDFVLAPERFAERKAAMLRGIETVRRLWRGEAVRLPGPDGEPVDVRTFPRPIQPELPIWLTAASNPETFRLAGEIGAGVLTHLLGQSLSELREKIRVYRDAWRRAGHGPERGSVALMVHTFLGDDEQSVREAVRRPLIEYLRSSVDLIRDAAWTFPTFGALPPTNGHPANGLAVHTNGAAASSGFQRSSDEAEPSPGTAGHGTRSQGVDARSPHGAGRQHSGQPFADGDLVTDDLEALLEHAFERYFTTSGLFGTPERCVEIVDEMVGCDVDEIACLVDFGVETETALNHLKHLARVVEARHAVTIETTQTPAKADDRSIAGLVRSHGVTHVQCTPSLARMLLLDEATRDALSALRVMLVGGEVLAPPLADELASLVGGTVLNGYGPTETTIWSTLHPVRRGETPVPIGRPIANTRVYVVDERQELALPGVAGELLIGGAGVARGYLGRPDLTAERFVPDRFSGQPSARLYRTGDRARLRPDGTLDYLGRLDDQVKVRGHRIEPTEVEREILAHPDVADAAVVAVEEPSGTILVAHVVARPGAAVDADAVRVWARERLPEPMVPSRVVIAAALPRTPNGKLDRRALVQAGHEWSGSGPVWAGRADGEAGAQVAQVCHIERRGRDALRVDQSTFGMPGAHTSTHAARISEAEEIVAAVWCASLGVGNVDPDASFFDLGGHSLLMAHVLVQLRARFGLNLALTDLFRFPTVRSLARYLDADPVSSGPNRQSAPRTSARHELLARRRQLRTPTVG